MSRQPTERSGHASCMSELESCRKELVGAEALLHRSPETMICLLGCLGGRVAGAGSYTVDLASLQLAL